MACENLWDSSARSCVLDTYEVTIGCSRKIPIDADARTVRPYRSSGISLVNSYLVTLSTNNRLSR